MRAALYLALVALYVLHNDLWLWNDARVVAGLPVGLVYHLLFCFVVVGVMSLLVSRAWPSELSAMDDEAVQATIDGSRAQRHGADSGGASP